MHQSSFTGILANLAALQMPADPIFSLPAATRFRYIWGMIEHVSVPISDYEKAKKFYLAALKPLDYILQRDYPSDAAGFCEGESTSLWIVKKPKPVQPIHVAMRAPSKQAVQQFYDAALKAGGKDNGGPGFRRDYGDDYYAAFVLDPDGNNIEACYFGDKAPPE
jgi:catechol 2,3-dioxygenase-like lactoylglutathione lyase family enzyme